MSCPAMLTIRGEVFPCDWPSDEDGRHDGWGHTSRAAEAVWCGDEGPQPLEVARAAEAVWCGDEPLPIDRDGAGRGSGCMSAKFYRCCQHCPPGCAGRHLDPCDIPRCDGQGVTA
jgi:hypothetical protein